VSCLRGGSGLETITAMAAARSAEELAEVADPAWPGLLELIGRAQVPVAVLPAAREAGLDVLFRLQVTARSTLGALALNCGGLLVDHGWVRVLGGGTSRLPDLATASGLGLPGSSSAPPPSLTVAFDVLGGRFAVNGGDLPGSPGEVCYWAPDTLAWMPTGAGHSHLVQLLLADGMATFYQDLRWPGWQAEAAAVAEDQGIAVYPFLFTAEGRDLAHCSRRPVPFAN
jgi:Protein of unknown function DUF2625